MFRLNILTFSLFVTCISLVLGVALSAWLAGGRHERLRDALIEHHAKVTMTNIEPTSEDLSSGTNSTLSRMADSARSSKLLRRIDSITLHTYTLTPTEIETVVKDAKAVHAVDELRIVNGSITNDQIVDLVCNLSIKQLTVNVEALRASQTKWIVKNDLKQISLFGDNVNRDALSMLPNSIENIQFMCPPAGDVDVAIFAKFPSLKSIEFFTAIDGGLKDELNDADKYQLIFPEER